MENIETEQTNIVQEDKQPLFINETKPNIDTYLKVAMALSKKKRLQFLLGGIAVIAIGFAYVFASAYIWQTDPGALPWIIFLFGLLMIVRALTIKLMAKKHLKESVKWEIDNLRYNFYDDCYEIVGLIDDNSPQNTATKQDEYKNVAECKEYKDFWLLYSDKSRLYVIVKSNFLQGDVASFTEFLASKLGARYKVCYKRKKDK